MPYDDIRFSHWDDPDDMCDECGYAIEDCACWDDPDEFEFVHEYECRTCGKEVSYIDENGDCSWCRMVNNG